MDQAFPASVKRSSSINIWLSIEKLLRYPFVISCRTHQQKKKWLQNSETLSNLPRRLHSYVAPMLSASPRQSTSMDKVQLIATSKRCLYQSLQCVLHADISNGINRILAAPCHSYVASMLFASLTTVHLHGRSSARCLYQSLQNVRGA